MFVIVQLESIIIGWGLGADIVRSPRRGWPFPIDYIVTLTITGVAHRAQISTGLNWRLQVNTNVGTQAVSEPTILTSAPTPVIMGAPEIPFTPVISVSSKFPIVILRKGSRKGIDWSWGKMNSPRGTCSGVHNHWGCRHQAS